jgi:GNAT superfamily N-acetyltransferase
LGDGDDHQDDAEPELVAQLTRRCDGAGREWSRLAFRSIAHLPARLLPMELRIRLGDAADVDAAVSVFEQSNLARRQGIWPNRAARVEHLRAKLRGPDAWFLVVTDGPAVVGMASAEALRAEGGAGPVIPGGWFLSYLFVVPERWGEGIGGAILDAVLVVAKRRDASRMHLWTHVDNERSHRLYRSRGFSPTGRSAEGEGEWVRDL